jgi:transcriptional regulator with XRE-family HTH domain
MNKLCQEKNTMVDIIKSELAIRKWTQVRLAKESGVRQPVISRLLNGSAQVGVANISRILGALGMFSVKSDMMQLKREVENLKEVISVGQSAGMTESPVGSTGKKRKAGSRG